MEKRGLLYLPNELLTQILSNIPRQSDLAKIALLSKHFKALVEPFLYRHINLDIQFSARELNNTRLVNRFSYTTIPSFVRFDRLIDSLSVDQNLGKLVHTLSLRVHRRLWYDTFDAHSRLLERLPRLRSLSLSPPPRYPSIPCNEWGLESLRLDFNHVTDHYGHEMRNEWMYIGIPLEIIARYLWLPRVRKVQVENVMFTPLFDKTRHLPLGSSSVEDFRFLNCWNVKSNRVLAAFLRSIKRLKCFVIEFPALSRRSVDIPPHSDAFGLALSAHQETIEELVIATSWDSPVIGWTLGPFTQWISLKRLAVPRHLILGTFPTTPNLHDILPPLLEEFQIQHPTGYNNGCLPQVAYRRVDVSSLPVMDKIRVDAAHANDVTVMIRLAENKVSCVPRLKRVIWWYQTFTCSSSQDPEYPSLIEVSWAFEKTGVEFDRVIGPFFKNTPFGKQLCEWQG